jgi:hypothetical protein
VIPSRIGSERKGALVRNHGGKTLGSEIACHGYEEPRGFDSIRVINCRGCGLITPELDGEKLIDLELGLGWELAFAACRFGG